VSGLFEDKFGRIWCHNFFGEILFIENDTLNKLSSWEQFYKDGFPTITNAQDSLLIQTGSHIYSYHLTKHTWSKQEINIESNTTLWSHRQDASGNLWVSYTRGKEAYVKYINRKHATSHQVTSQGKALNSNGSQFIAWKDSLLLFDPTYKRLFNISSNEVVEVTKRYALALSTARQVKNIGDSLLVFLSAKGLTQFRTNKKWNKFLPTKNVSCIAYDAEEGIWVGTLNEGLYYLPNQTSTLYSKEKYGLFPKLSVYSKDNLLVAGDYSGNVRVFRTDTLLLLTNVENTLKETQSLFIDEENQTLLTSTSSLNFYDLKTGHKFKEEEFASVKEIISLEKELALATSAGLYLYNPQTKKRRLLFGPQRVATVVYDKNSKILWAGTQKGLYTYSLSSHRATQWESEIKGYSPGVISSLLLRDYVILGTLTNGLYILLNGNIIHHLTTKEGLSSNRIASLAVNKNTIWMGTDRGVCSFDLGTKKISIINKIKGLAAEEVYDIACVNEQLWISHALGLQRFTILPTTNTQKPIIHINTASTNGTPIRNLNSGITLQPSSQQLILTFDVSNTLRSNGLAKILYRIVELDGNRWNETILQTATANYASLPFGKYTFEAVAKNEDGILSSNRILIPLHVIAPFWKQVWFTSALFILALSIVASLIYYRLKKINTLNKIRLQQQSQEQELRIAQLTSIRAQMNPHFIFNTMSLIQGKVLNGQQDEATQSIQDFSLLLRKVLDFSGKEMISLQEEIEVLEKYLAIEKDRFDGLLDFTIQVNKEAQEEMIRIPSLLTQPFVENALRHGLMHKEGKKELRISFSLSGTLLTVTIDDNGVGRKVSAELNKARRAEHTSFAMNAYEKRIALLNATRRNKIKLDIIDKQSTFATSEGTTVQITIPLYDEHRE
jgi:ligand-binding sensor domain-containing protein